MERLRTGPSRVEAFGCLNDEGRMKLHTRVHGIESPLVRLFAFLVVGLGPLASWIHAAETADVPAISATATDNGKTEKDKDQSLDEVVVTGTLIPRTKIEDFTPVLTITNEDIQARGFADVAEALQRASFSTAAYKMDNSRASLKAPRSPVSSAWTRPTPST